MTVDMKLPEPPPEKKEGRWLSALTLIGVLLLLAVVLLDSSFVSLPDEQEQRDRTLAEVLEARTLHREAAALWEKVAESADEPSLPLFRAGRSRMLAGEPERAVRNFLAAENRGLPETLRGDSSRFVLECYAMLGKTDVRNAALKARTGSLGADAGTVIARLGEEDILRSELVETVRQQEAMRLAAQGGLDRKSLEDAVTARMADPAALAPVLRGLLSQRALALEALSQGFETRPEVMRRMASLRRELLGNLLIQERLLSTEGISESDLRDYYAAHRERFRLPAVVRYSYAPVAADGKTPGEFTAVESLHARGDEFAGGRGASAEADAALFALETGQVTATPISIGGTPLFLRLDEKQEAKPLPFESVKSRVQGELAARRRVEAVSRLQSDVATRYPVEILDPGLREAMRKTEGAPDR